MRWLTPDGQQWASRFEATVFDGVSKQLGEGRVRRCTEQDQMGYTRVVPRSECAKCGSSTVVQRRKITTDFLVVPAQVSSGPDKQGGYFIEVKGFVRANRRALFRDFIKCYPNLDLRFVLERDYVISKASGLTLGGWITKYLKRPWCVWRGQLPAEWL